MLVKAFCVYINLLILILVNTVAENDDLTASNAGDDFSYDDPRQWGYHYPLCAIGKLQSPISFSRLDPQSLLFISPFGPIPPIRFINYHLSPSNDMVMRNNGETVEINIPESETPSYISGGTLQNEYRAINVHFHWGSKNKKGSEHAVENQRYDSEMHIVHQNTKYKLKEDAFQKPDGITVLGFFFKIEEDSHLTENNGLRKFFNILPKVQKVLSTVQVDNTLTLQELIKSTNRNNYFTYNGSLTTPPCSESVTWFVFLEPIPVAYKDMEKFWNIRNRNGYLRNNNRPLQNQNKRLVFYSEI